jgi:Holliday junction resolvase RusA-like endonuclease
VIDLFLPCIPPTASHHQKRIVRFKLKSGQTITQLADEPALVQAKKTIDTLLQAHRVSRPLRGAVSLTLEFTWPWRTSDSKRVRGRGRIPRDTRPDCSNLAKTTEDRLVAMGFLVDDGQVVELTVRKFFGSEPGIGVRLAAVDAPLLSEASA